jgi:hypothetical protein
MDNPSIGPFTAIFDLDGKALQIIRPYTLKCMTTGFFGLWIMMSSTRQAWPSTVSFPIGIKSYLKPGPDKLKGKLQMYGTPMRKQARDETKRDRSVSQLGNVVTWERVIRLHLINFPKR